MESVEEVVVAIWYWLQLQSQEEKNTRLWIHHINEKRTTHDTLNSFITEFHSDENKFRNVTRLKLSTFDYLFRAIKDKITE